MKNLTYYGLTHQELQAKHKSTGVFATAKDGLSPSCGNGSYHASSTRDKAKVTCEACRKLIKG